MKERLATLVARRGQKWILDAFIAQSGRDILHPGSNAFMEQQGYDHSDIEAVFGSVKCTDMQAKAWTKRGCELAKRAEWAETQGYKVASYHMYLRAALCFGRAQRDVKTNPSMKEVLHAKLVQYYVKAMQYSPVPMERVVLPFEGQHVYGVFFKHPNIAKAPCILLVPGMDMVKEDWTKIAQTYVIPSGFSALAIDGPGQGETLLHGGYVTQDNYERAGRVFVDYLVNRQDVDADNIVLLGVSMGSYWGTRIAGYDQRLKAAATALGCYGPKDAQFHEAQPSFFKNYSYMAGIKDPLEFDEFQQGMRLEEIAKEIKMPFLIVQGEMDELSPLEDVYKFYETLTCPKEIWIYENQFHPMGPVSAEAFPAFVGWLRDKVDNPVPADLDKHVYVRQSGGYREGKAINFWFEA